MASPSSGRCSARSRSPACCSASAAGREARCCGVARRGRPCRGARLARRADLGLRPGRDAARLRVRPALPGPGPRPRPRPAAGGAVLRDRLDASQARERALSRIAGTKRHTSAGGRSRRVVAGGAVVLVACSPSRSATRSSATTCESRYANPTFTTPGLNAAFKWARSISGARIATTSTRQYPLFGTDLSNRVAVRRRQSAPRRLRRPIDLPRLAPPPRRRRLRLRQSPPATGSNPASPPIPRPAALDRRLRAPRRSCASRPRSSSSSAAPWIHRPARAEAPRAMGV